MNNQIPSTIHQIMTELPITKMLGKTERDVLVIWTLGNWNLFGDWSLVIGI
jgi:hypothetical protein